MSDDEDEQEMARMREAVNARRNQLNEYGVSKSFNDLREKQKRTQEMAIKGSVYFEGTKIQEDGPTVAAIEIGQCNGRPRQGPKRENDAPGYALTDQADIHEELRAQFPLSFGKKEEKRNLEDIHSKTKRLGTTATTATTSTKARSGTKNSESSLTYPKQSHGGDDLGGSLASPGSTSPDPDDNIIGPPLPPKDLNSGEDDDEDVDADDYGPVVDIDEYQVPLSNEIVLRGHTKVVSALAIDPTGSRVLTGSYDYMVKMYDFQGMDTRLRSFRQLEPFEGHQVRSLSWSPTADRFLVATGSAQAKVYDRDGLTLGQSIKGDMYIRDLKNTKGHICGLTKGEWHPKDKETILTSSEDGSIRIWDVTCLESQKQVIKPKLARPGRVAVTTCSWGMEGKCITGGLADGSIQIWNVKAAWGSRPDIYVVKAHQAGEEISSLQFSKDGNTLLSRSTDSTLKVWDIRQMDHPLKSFDGLSNAYAQSNAIFSPDERLIVVGTSVEREGTSGGLLWFFDKQRLELVRKVGISPSQSVICCNWHPRLNQIFATVGDKKEGCTHILYDPAVSERGALSCVARAPRKKTDADFEVKPVVRNPHALPLFRDEPSRKRQREKARADPVKSRRPDLPMTGPGHGGRVGTTKGSLLTQYLLKEGGLMKETWMEEDPREAILKYADAAAKDPKYIAPAYADTQPKTIFASSESDEEK